MKDFTMFLIQEKWLCYDYRAQIWLGMLGREAVIHWDITLSGVLFPVDFSKVDLADSTMTHKGAVEAITIEGRQFRHRDWRGGEINSMWNSRSRSNRFSLPWASALNVNWLSVADMACPSLLFHRKQDVFLWVPTQLISEIFLDLTWKGNSWGKKKRHDLLFGTQFNLLDL